MFSRIGRLIHASATRRATKKRETRACLGCDRLAKRLEAAGTEVFRLATPNRSSSFGPSPDALGDPACRCCWRLGRVLAVPAAPTPSFRGLPDQFGAVCPPVTLLQANPDVGWESRHEFAPPKCRKSIRLPCRKSHVRTLHSRSVSSTLKAHHSGAHVATSLLPTNEQCDAPEPRSRAS